MDDAYIGGERSGKRGRGACHKAPFIAVVETDEETHRPQRMQLRTARGFRSTEIERYAKVSLAPESRVISDGLACFMAVKKAGCHHVGIISEGGRKGVEHPSFKWVNTMLGNVKNAITGTFHSVDLKHVPRYLAEFEYRFRNHGESLVVMRLPKEKILFIVDIVTPRRVAFRAMPDFWPDEWIRSLKEIEEMDFDYVISAHGPEGQPAIDPASVVEEQRVYLEELMAAVKKAMDSGTHNPDVLRKTVKLPKYKDWQYYEEWLPMNIERIWAYYHMGY